MAKNDERERDRDEPPAEGGWKDPEGEDETSGSAEAAPPSAPAESPPAPTAFGKPGKPLEAVLWAFVLVLLGLGILAVLAQLPSID
jgi:hypothetical protein